MNPDLEFLIACGVLDDVLDEAETERLEAGLERDPDGLAWSEALGAAYAELKAAPEPSPALELWERIAASVEAGADAEADDAPAPDEAADAPLISIALACSYCHDVLARAEAAYCASCLAPHHGECFSEHGRCAAPGCGETHWVRAQAPAPAARRRAGFRDRLALVLGLGALAGAAVAAFGWGREAGAPGASGEEPRPQISVLDSQLSEPGEEAPVTVDPVVSDPGSLRYVFRVSQVAGTEVTLEEGPDHELAPGVSVGDHVLLLTSRTFDQPTWIVRVASLDGEGRARAERAGRLSFYTPAVGDLAVRCDAEGNPLETGVVEGPRPAEGAEVYYLTGQPTWQFRYLSSYLNTASGARLQSFLESADPQWTPPTHPELSPLRQVRTTCPADLVVLGPTTLAAPPPGLREFVEAGGGLILLAGGAGQVREFGAEAALLSPVEDMQGAPATVITLGEEPKPVYPRPARELAPLRSVERDELPPLLANRSTRLRRSARALLRDGTGAPLIAQWSVGRGQVLYVGTQELWRLRSLDSPSVHSSVYHELWAELLTRALAEEQPPSSQVELDSLIAAPRVSGELKQGTPVYFDLYRCGATSLVHAATLRGSVQPVVGGASRVVIEAPSRVVLPPARYAWQACATSGVERVVLGVGWVDHQGPVAGRAVDPPPCLRLTEDELRARLGIALLAGLPEFSEPELERIREASVALLAEGSSLLDGYAEMVQGLVDGTLAPDAETTRELVGVLLRVDSRADVVFEREAQLPSPQEAQVRLAHWDSFGQAEYAYNQGERAWLEGLAAFEIAKLTLGWCWSPPAAEGVEPVQRRKQGRFEPPWAYLLGQLEGEVAVDPRCVPPRFPVSARSACAIDPLACLIFDGRPRSLLDFARRQRARGAPDLERSGLQRALNRGLPRDEELGARTRLVRLGLKACEADPSLHPEVVTQLQALLRLLADPVDAGALRGELAKLLARLDAEQRVVVADLAELAAGLERYRADLGRYPAGLRELYRDVGASSGPDRGRRGGWRGPYAMWPSDRPGQPPSEEAAPTPTDPWGSRYSYARRDGDGYTLISVGSDQALGGEGAARDLRWIRD